MTRVLLLHSGFIPHYRIPIYGKLSKYLLEHGFELIVASDRLQSGSTEPVEFRYEEVRLSVASITRLVYREAIDIVLLFVDMRHRYLFPTYFVTKTILRRKIIYWGQGLNLADPGSIKSFAYRIEHALSDAIILYAEHLKKYIAPRHHKKTFAANNTLCISYPGLLPGRRETVLSKYGIHTPKNIICVGRLQKRKRLDHLIAAHSEMRRPDIGLIFIGPDTDGVLAGVQGKNIYNLGPIYSNDRFDLLSAADVYCLPGAVGLSIVDAFHCGLPFVTEEGDESAEMMYLKDGKNGFVVPKGNLQELAAKLLLLIDNDQLRARFSAEAKREVAESGSIDVLCRGFKNALCYVNRQESNGISGIVAEQSGQ